MMIVAFTGEKWSVRGELPCTEQPGGAPTGDIEEGSIPMATDRESECGVVLMMVVMVRLRYCLVPVT